MKIVNKNFKDGTKQINYALQLFLKKAWKATKKIPITELNMTIGL